MTDMMGNKIYAIKNGKASIFAEGEDLEYPTCNHSPDERKQDRGLQYFAMN